eukprot:scaffold21924_cov62-Phaeocystis_antarctica.AAC.11
MSSTVVMSSRKRPSSRSPPKSSSRPAWTVVQWPVLSGGGPPRGDERHLAPVARAHVEGVQVAVEVVGRILTAAQHEQPRAQRRDGVADAPGRRLAWAARPRQDAGAGRNAGAGQRRTQPGEAHAPRSRGRCQACAPGRRACGLDLPPGDARHLCGKQGLPRASASLGQSAAWAALAGHIGLVFRLARHVELPQVVEGGLGRVAAEDVHGLVHGARAVPAALRGRLGRAVLRHPAHCREVEPVEVVEAPARRAAAKDEDPPAEAHGRVRPAWARPLADGAGSLDHNRRLLRLVDAGPSAGCCVKEPRVVHEGRLALPTAEHEQPRADGRERGRLPLLGRDAHGVQVLPPATAQRTLLVQHPQVVELPLLALTPEDVQPAVRQARSTVQEARLRRGPSVDQ